MRKQKLNEKEKIIEKLKQLHQIINVTAYYQCFKLVLDDLNALFAIIGQLKPLVDAKELLRRDLNINENMPPKYHHGGVNVSLDLIPYISPGQNKWLTKL